MNRSLIGVLAVILMPINNSVVAQSTLDGRWSVEAVPEKGICRRTHRYTVMIEHGRVRDGTRHDVDITGGLEASGRLRGTVQRNRTRIHVTGRLVGRSGTGDWVAEGGVTCSGRWRADRRT